MRICTSKQEAWTEKSPKELMTHCWTSRPNVSSVFTVDKTNPGFVEQQISIRVSTFLLSTSNYEHIFFKKLMYVHYALCMWYIYMDKNSTFVGYLACDSCETPIKFKLFESGFKLWIFSSRSFIYSIVSPSIDVLSICSFFFISQEH